MYLSYVLRRTLSLWCRSSHGRPRRASADTPGEQGGNNHCTQLGDLFTTLAFTCTTGRGGRRLLTSCGLLSSWGLLLPPRQISLRGGIGGGIGSISTNCVGRWQLVLGLSGLGGLSVEVLWLLLLLDLYFVR